MSLSEDSRALLALLLARGKSYADIAGLLGIEEAEVRGRAATALAELEPSKPAPDAELTDYLLGQSDPIARADTGNRIGSDPALAEQAESLTDQLQLLVPGAKLPKPGSAEGGRPRPATAADPARDASDGGSGKSGSSHLSAITDQQRRLIALLLGAALLAVVVILLLTGTFSGDSDDDSDTPRPADTVAVLEPVQGQQGSGKVQFGFAGTEFAANLNFTDLKPTKKGKGYVLWLDGATGAFPIHASEVGRNGSISGQIPVMEAVSAWSRPMSSPG